jgi:hypothetical protein
MVSLGIHCFSRRATGCGGDYASKNGHRCLAQRYAVLVEVEVAVWEVKPQEMVEKDGDTQD